VEVERPGNKLRLIIRTARPGIIIGRKGAEIDKLKADIQKRTNREVFIDILEVNKPELDAQLVSRTSRYSWKSASASAALCARVLIRRCASAARASRCVSRAG
jgi:ribosomal protein S3